MWHDLPTSFNDFKNFAKEILLEVEGFYSLDTADKELWSDFENDLGYFVWKKFYDYHCNIDFMSESFRPSEFYSLQDELTEQSDHHVEEIKKAFQEWVEGIDISDVVKKMDFPQDSSFISFNYTSTLQSVYGISEARVFHVHGRADNLDDLIFGHGKTIEEEPEQDENGDSNRTMFTDSENAAKYPFYALQKPVNEVLKKNDEFFKSARSVSEIIVMGHSLNDIDLPYFKELATWASGAHWLVCCYKISEVDHVTTQLINCGVQCARIQTMGYGDLVKMSKKGP
jgi:hypothetical protein